MLTLVRWRWRGVQSKAYERGRFSVEIEEGACHLQRLLDRAYRAAPP